MMLSFIQAKFNLKKWTALGITLLVVNTCPVVFAQEDQDNDPASIDISTPVESSNSTPTVGSGPWRNATSISPDRSTSPGGSSSGGALARPGNGSTVLDPGDGPPNPDVPFDTNMNIAFLVVGLVFAFVVYRKRFAVKSDPLTK